MCEACSKGPEKSPLTDDLTQPQPRGTSAAAPHLTPGQVSCDHAMARAVRSARCRMAVTWNDAARSARTCADTALCAQGRDHYATSALEDLLSGHPSASRPDMPQGCSNKSGTAPAATGQVRGLLRCALICGAIVAWPRPSCITRLQVGVGRRPRRLRLDGAPQRGLNAREGEVRVVHLHDHERRASADLQ